MITNAQMRIIALDAMADGLDTYVRNARLTEALGLNAKQRDVNRLQIFLRAEAGKLRAKVEIAKEAQRMKRIQKDANE
jgi:hypothetical protein